MCGGMYTTIANGYRRCVERPVLPAARENKMTPSNERLQFIMDIVAFHSGDLEGTPWDRWELHAEALQDAYALGASRQPVTLYRFFRWHGAILPHGGTLRQSNPVSVAMGESFQPHNYLTLPARVAAFIEEWHAALANCTDHWLTLSKLHFTQWQIHPYPDGNKRHARLMTVYGCGWFGLPPVCITLAEKPKYLDALRDADRAALARLFEAHTIGDNDHAT